jgi:hypothetical protein
MGLWKVKDDADPAMVRSAQDKVVRFTEILPGCLEARWHRSMCPR